MDTQLREPTTVGSMLQKEFLEPLGVTQQQLADAMKVSRKVVSQIVNGQRRLSIDEAVQLAVLFELDDDFWINLQAAHDRWEARQLMACNPYEPLSRILKML
jgi:putative transposase